MLPAVFLLVGLFMAPIAPLPDFRAHTIATDLKGGYQVVAADLNRDGRTDLIALASGMPDLVWFENPGWERHVIAGGFSEMINLTVVESGARSVIVLASGFSSDARKSPGIVSVLEPAGDVREPWKVTEIDRLPTSHRLLTADVEGSGMKVVVNAPLTRSDATPPDYRGSTPLVFYRPGEWKRRLIGEETPGVMHGIHVTDWDGDGRDEILTASFAGIHLYKLGRDGTWARSELAQGDPAAWPKCGSSDVAVGHLGRQRFLCAIEPWHGNRVAVYRRENGSWLRQVIDESYADGHVVRAADLNSDGHDEIIAGHRGSGGGVYIYVADDEDGRRWQKHTLDRGGIAAASCAVTDLNGDGAPDIACIGSASANLKWYENRQDR
jgi:hypothetical protein